MQRLFVGFHLGTSDLAAELMDEPAPETDNLLDPVEVGAGLMVWAELNPAAVLGSTTSRLRSWTVSRSTSMIRIALTP